ncbi:phage major capsid protein [Bradyrhizobiaceae bacterium SG-6C]|nr:phage major capsid protein [Bradyrhizobiaceae bacterium SG-6C]
MATAMAAIRMTGAGGASGGNPKTAAALKSFGSFAQTGIMPHNAMTTDNDPKGGFLVPEEVGSTIADLQRNFSPMRRLATVRSTTSDSYEQLVNIGGGTAAWVGEKQARPETEGVTLVAINIPSHEIYANPSASQKLLDDSAFNVANLLSNSIAQDFETKEGAAFITGDGIMQPKGILSVPIVATADDTRAFGSFQYIASGVAAALTDGTHNGADALIDLTYALKAGYRSNARWLMNSATAAVVRKFKDEEGRYIWQQSIAAGQPSTLNGYPVEFDENMQDIGANSYPIAFGDFAKGYMITDRVGVRVLRDPFTNKPFVMFYTTKRVGGSPIDTNAIKFLKVAAS